MNPMRKRFYDEDNLQEDEKDLHRERKTWSELIFRCLKRQRDRSLNLIVITKLECNQRCREMISE